MFEKIFGDDAQIELTLHTESGDQPFREIRLPLVTFSTKIEIGEELRPYYLKVTPMGEKILRISIFTATPKVVGILRCREADGEMIKVVGYACSALNE